MAHKESIVRKGYYEIAEEYSADRNRFDHLKDLKEFTELLPKKTPRFWMPAAAPVFLLPDS